MTLQHCRMESVRALGVRLVSWWSGWRPHARTDAFAAEPFTEARIRRAPAARGIYQLYRDGDPEAALREYLRTYMASNGGRLPPSNQSRQGIEPRQCSD